MAWETPKTWSDTEDRLNATNLNRYVRDNQLALRADAAALGQRVTALEGAGFSAPIMMTVSLGSGSRWVSELQPPSNCRLVYIAVQWTLGSKPWVGAPLMDYGLWSGFAETPSGENPASGQSWAADTTQVGLSIYKATGGYLAIRATRSAFGAVCLRWYT